MKITFIVLLAIPVMTLAYPSALDEVEIDEGEIEAIEKVVQRTDDARIKRSGLGGSGGFLSGIKQNILSSVGKASASIASGSSSSSSGSSSSGGGGKGYEYGHPNEIEFDGAQLKKNILNTLFQAVKAITGGVTAIKGQLIKGSGYLISGGGKLIAASGDQVTNVGKKIATSAKLVPASHGGGSGIAGAFGASSSSLSGSSSGGHTAPTGHGESFTSYESPPVIHTGYGPPDSHASYPSGPSSHGPAASYGVPVNHAPAYVSTNYGPPSSHGGVYA